MFHQSKQNIRQRAACLARRHQIHVERRKNAPTIAQRLRKTPALDQRLMKRTRHLLDARLLETLFQDRQSFVERLAGLKQMAELLSKNEQLAMGNFQLLRWRC